MCDYFSSWVGDVGYSHQTSAQTFRENCEPNGKHAEVHVLSGQTQVTVHGLVLPTPPLA